ncbi:MAG: hypothetical protein ABS79_02175 [Planctomycetes bacterium SCN 63-9]|nr:MAG: hypothetical protein ABS79_02175 [Planctomycetes bacterium SCN 63-9]
MAQSENRASNPVEAEIAIPLIREGWDHLREQSPLAAWGSWQKAIRLDPDSQAAQKALSTLESAGELPSAARARYRFQAPRTAEQRERWDARLRTANPEALDGAAGVFSDLTEQDPDDAEAWYNRALCLGWNGQNLEAIACLDRYVPLRAATDLQAAAEAWTLAEVLRQGKGAESLADELRFSASISWSAEDSGRLKHHFPGLKPLPTPAIPTSDAIAPSTVVIYEWLDQPTLEEPRPEAEPNSAPPATGSTLLATVYEGAEALRLSSPRSDTLETALERLAQVFDLAHRPVRREAAPLPLPFLDAQVWTIRFPGGLDQAVTDRLTREHVESYYENEWIHGKRHGLDGRSPLEASRPAANGDRTTLAKLTGIIRFQEQLATRASVGFLYQGYPFDRLRVRLGLEPADGNSVDPEELASASSNTLGRLDPASLADARLASAFESANGLRDDALAEKFALELMRRPANARQGVDLLPLAACLVRREMEQGQPDRAIEWIGRFESEATPHQARQLTTWRAEILARQGRADDAAELYRTLIDSDPKPAVVALDAAETLLDNGESVDARTFLEWACEAALDDDLRGVERRAEALLSLLDDAS